MPAAVAHTITGLFLGERLRNKFFSKYSQFFVLVCGIAGLFPDIDIAVYFVLRLFIKDLPFQIVHRGFTHTIFFPLIFLAAALVALALKKEKPFVLFYMISVGTLSHVVLDFVLTQRIALFYPLSDVTNGIGLVPDTQFGRTIVMSIDAVLLTLWIVYLYWKGHIKKFF